MLELTLSCLFWLLSLRKGWFSGETAGTVGQARPFKTSRRVWPAGVESTGTLGVEMGPVLLVGSRGVTGRHIEGKRWKFLLGRRMDFSMTSKSARELQEAKDGRNMLGSILGFCRVLSSMTVCERWKRKRKRKFEC